MLKRVFVLVCGLMMIASVAFAQISSEDASNVVRQNFPGSEIHYVEHEWDDGMEYYEVHFSYNNHYDCECKVSVNDGHILGYDIDN